MRVGKKFTGGSVILKNFASLGDAKEWILGETQKLRAKPGSLIELKALAGNAAFRLSPAQITEAADAFRRLSETSLTLTEAVSYAIQHACPTAGTLSVADAIKAAQKAKSGRRPAYRADMFRRWRRLERWLPANNRKAINTITQLMIRKFLSDCDLKPSNRANNRPTRGSHTMAYRRYVRWRPSRRGKTSGVAPYRLCEAAY